MFEEERREPSPEELKQQLSGAAVAMRFVNQMMKHYPKFWERMGEDISDYMSTALYQAGSQKTHPNRLWKLFMSQKPEQDDE